MERGRPSSFIEAFTRGVLAALGVVWLAAPVSAQTSQASVRYSVVGKEIRWHGQSALGPTNPAAEVIVRDNSDNTLRIEVPLHQRDLVRDQPDELETTVVADRALVVIPSESYCKEVAVVGLPSGKIVDSFMGCRVSLSPDKTRAAFTYYAGRSMIQDHVVAVYDFTRTPLENASLGYQGRSYVPKGIILYPPENKARGAYETRSEPLKTVTSPFAWCGNDRIAFLAATGSETHLIEMSLPEDARQAKVIADQLVDVSELRSKVPARDWPLERPLPALEAGALSYQEGCRWIHAVPLHSSLYDTKVITLPACDSNKP